MHEWINKWVELSQLHDVFRAFLADFRDTKTHDLRMDGRTSEPPYRDAKTHLKWTRSLGDIVQKFSSDKRHINFQSIHPSIHLSINPTVNGEDSRPSVNPSGIHGINTMDHSVVSYCKLYQRETILKEKTRECEWACSRISLSYKKPAWTHQP